MRTTRVSKFSKGNKAPEFSTLLHDGSVMNSGELHQQKYIVHRTTFVIDAEGLIEAVIHPVDSARHVTQILDALNPEL